MLSPWPRSDGEVPERSIGAVSKTVVPFAGHRGFESLPLRHSLNYFINLEREIRQPENIGIGGVTLLCQKAISSARTATNVRTAGRADRPGVDLDHDAVRERHAFRHRPAINSAIIGTARSVPTT